MIVRIATEGQFEVEDSVVDQLNDLDRQLSELTSGAQVDDELAKMKSELGSGGGDAPALEQGEEKA